LRAGPPSAEIADALAYTLLYGGKRRAHHADDAMARITTEYPIRHVAQAGFVLMREPPGAAPTTAIMPPSTGHHRRPAPTNVASSDATNKIHRIEQKYLTLLTFRYRMGRRHGPLPSPLAQRAANGVQ
jgi:hypothetical protein